MSSAGDAVTVHYDPMLAKLICWAPDRAQAFARLRAALEQVEIVGLKTNARFLWDILGDERVLEGDVSTRYLEQRPRGRSGACSSANERRVDRWLRRACSTRLARSLRDCAGSVGRRRHGRAATVSGSAPRRSYCSRCSIAMSVTC